ncbi:MAG: isopentenyl-diphosphate Delta-isomerase [Wenzhouxiangella sp.]
MAAAKQVGEARVVSSDAEPLILVDEQDRELGLLSKGECHDGDGLLHRAFSVFLFDESGRLLIQQRAPGKRLWPGYWANSCCSHPRAGENMAEATQRRIEEELGLSVDLEFIYKFRYQARYGEEGSEHELCWVHLGRIHSSQPRPNPSEIADWKFLTVDQVNGLMNDASAPVAPWFRMEWASLLSDYAPRLALYLQTD